MTATPTQRTPAVDIDELAAAIAGINRVLRRDLHLPVGASTLSALVTIVDHGPIKMGDLAHHEGITPATLTRIVSALDEHGYIVRQVAPDDRRATYLSASASGKRLLQSIRKQRGQLLRERVLALSADEQGALSQALVALVSLST